MAGILVHIHLFYPEIWDETAACLSHISDPFDLVVTLTDENPEIARKIRKFKPDARVSIVENKGFDVGPFIKVLHENGLDGYEYVIHLHSKRNVKDILGNVVLNDETKWRRLLLDFCSSDENWRATMRTFRNNPEAGMVSDRVCILDEKFDPTPEMAEAAKKYLVDRLKMPVKRAVFVCGTMFMVRAALLKPVVESVSFDDFSETERKEFLTLGHVFERVFGYAVCAQGYEIVDYKGRSCTMFPARLFPAPFFIRFGRSVRRFVFQRKTDKKGNVLIKILKIPVWRKKAVKR